MLAISTSDNMKTKNLSMSWVSRQLQSVYIISVHMASAFDAEQQYVLGLTDSDCDRRSLPASMTSILASLVIDTGDLQSFGLPIDPPRKKG